MYGYNGLLLYKDVAKDCGVNTWVVRDLAKKLGIGVVASWIPLRVGGARRRSNV
jgi:hypothetical protein